MLNWSPYPCPKPSHTLLSWVEGPPKGKDGNSPLQGSYASGQRGCSPSCSLLSQPALTSIYLPRHQARLWGRNVLSTVMLRSSASANIRAVGVWTSPSPLVVSVGHLPLGCPLCTPACSQHEGSPLPLLTQTSPRQVCPNVT